MGDHLGIFAKHLEMGKKVFVGEEERVQKESQPLPPPPLNFDSTLTYST